MAAGEVESLSARARALRREGRPADALLLVEQAIALNPGSADLANQLGITLRQMRRAEEAVASFDSAIELMPTLASAHSNRANALRDLGRREAAIEGYDNAIRLRPDDALAWQNRGVVLAEAGQHEAAFVSLEKALSLDANLVESHWNLALVLLRRGDFERGWREFEWRWHKPDIAMSARHFEKSRWAPGQPMEGRTMLVCGEQGLGDTLQFCRYLPWLQVQGARTKLLVQPELVSLLQGQLGLEEVLTTGSRMPTFDVSCSLMSLPLFAGTTTESVPLPDSYLRASPAAVAEWRERLSSMGKPRIGLVWSGRPEHGNDLERSLSLEQLLTALPVGPQYVSLQKLVRASDVEALRSRSDIADFAPLLTDMAATAALCECMDLVISVDTSVAHLAGALGKPVCLLLPFNPDWRWLLDRNTTPWYSHMTLLRQSAPGDWSGVLGKLAARLSSSDPTGTSCSN